MHDEDETERVAPGLYVQTGLTALTRRHRRVWLAVAALLGFAGVGGSVYAFGSVRGAYERSHQALVSSSVEVAAALRLAIQHEQDLIVSTESFIVGNPSPSQSQFTQWANEVGVLKRYPELLGLAVVRYVPAPQLAAYAERASTDGSTSFSVVPPGKEPFYCFAPVGVERSGGVQIPTNYNLCAGSLGQKVLDARASGSSAVLPLTEKLLALDVPIYSTGSVPSTVAARDRAFVELIGMDVRPNILLQTALSGHPDTAVALRFGSGPSAVTFRGGHIPPSAQSITTDLHNGWSVETTEAVIGDGTFGAAGGFPLLTGGIALTSRGANSTTTKLSNISITHCAGQVFGPNI